MKKKILSRLVLALFMAFLCSGASLTARTTEATNNPADASNQEPEPEYDTDEWFGATGYAYGSRNQRGQLQSLALTNAQDMVRQKMQHSYEGFINTYMESLNTENGDEVMGRALGAGRQVINCIVNDTKVTKLWFSPVDEKGKVTCVVNIRVDKKELADKLANDADLKKIFKDTQFRERAQEAFELFKDVKE